MIQRNSRLASLELLYTPDTLVCELSVAPFHEQSPYTIFEHVTRPCPVESHFRQQQLSDQTVCFLHLARCVGYMQDGSGARHSLSDSRRVTNHTGPLYCYNEP